MSVLRLRGLTVGHSGRPVLADVDCELGSGQLLSLVGTNGSGKSTLLKSIVGLLPMLAGTIEKPAGISYLAQAASSASSLALPARDVVLTARYSSLGLLRRPRVSDREAVEEAMVRMDVASLADRPLRELSGGQQQRVLLAQALAKRAELLVLDEPTAGLDPGHIERFAHVLDEERQRGTAVVVATHDIRDAMRSDQAILLAGRVVASGPPKSVLTAERLLDAFGMAFIAVPHEDHHDVIAAENPHGHAHHGHSHST